MIKRIAAIASVALLLGTTIPAFAAEKKMTTAEMTEMCKTMGVEDCRIMMREMLKRPELHKMILEETNNSADFGKYRKDHPSGGG